MTTRDQLETALRAMLGAYCGEDGETREDCQAAEAMAREALAAIEPEEEA
jgi:hypothetical protein